MTCFVLNLKQNNFPSVSKSVTCCGVFDHTVKLLDCVTKLTLDQGEEPLTSCKVLVIESMEDPGRQRNTQEGVGRDLEIQGSYGLGWMERHFLAGSAAK